MCQIGILGIGRDTRITLPASRAKGWEVTVIRSRTEADADRQAAEHKIPVATKDVRAVAESDDLGALAIVTPARNHRDLIIQALAAGKDILAEKPMSMNMAGTAAIYQPVNDARAIAMTSFDYRFTLDRLHIQQLLTDGHVDKFQHTSASQIGTAVEAAEENATSVGGSNCDLAAGCSTSTTLTTSTCCASGSARAKRLTPISHYSCHKGTTRGLHTYGK